MVDIDVTYTGDLHCDATHRPSSTVLSTDAPADNHGKGESFSPTDLVATALGTCMVTTMGIRAHEAWMLDGTRVHVKKLMTTKPPRRIARLEVEITVPPEACATLDGTARDRLIEIAETCPVRLSLLDAIQVPIIFAWQDAR